MEKSSHGTDVIKDKGSPHFPKEASDCASSVTGSTNDVFKGQVLVDRLLVYYAKFEGCRDRAGKYAQKLLDLGHIESLTNSLRFEDSPHVYRWTDVSQVVNKAKERASSRERAAIAVIRRSREQRTAEVGKAVLKISIETEHCQGAEIQARIKASPKKNTAAKNSFFETKTVTATTEDSFFNERTTKSYSYVTEPTANDLNKNNGNEDTPIITEFKSPRQDKTPERKPRISQEIKEQVNQGNSDEKHISSPRKEAYKAPTKQAPIPDRESEPITNLRPSVNKKNEEEKPEKVEFLPFKSATEPAIVFKRPPGPAVMYLNPTPISKANPKHLDNQSAVVTLSKTSPTSPNDTALLKDEKLSDKLSPEGYSDVTPELRHPASTQTSEKSILKASMLYNGAQDITTTPVRPPIGRPSDPEPVGTSKSKELLRVNENVRKKTRFEDQVIEYDIPANEEAEYLTSELHYDVADTSNQQNNMSLHSSSVPDENFFQEKYGLPPISPPLSPLLSLSPTSPSDSLVMKSLFWNKISIPEEPANREKIFWEEIKDFVDCIPFDKEEFENLFRRPAQSPTTPRVKAATKGSDERGKILKVLSLERSRQVGIRANSVRLPITELHDAVINMEDDKLDLDGLQALYDVRPTPQELDEIADTLKLKPRGILDKPEQFILMLAMIPNLDERLQCWIFAKRFPDQMVDIHNQLISINESCKQIISNETIRKVLEIVLVLGNHMNKGTQRGSADGYYLDILPKLKDVKSQEGNCTLLNYVVKMVRKQMFVDGNLDESQVVGTPRPDDMSRLPDQDLLLRATSSSLSEIGDELEATAIDLTECKDRLLPAIIKGSTIESEAEVFNEKMEKFLENATTKVRDLAKFYEDTLHIAEEFKKFFIPENERDKKETLLNMLRSVTLFCEDFRTQWTYEHRLAAKEEYYKMEKGRKQRQASILVSRSPSALKERFMEKRRRERNLSSEKNEPETKPKSYRMISINLPRETPTEDPIRNRTPIPKRSYKFEDQNGHVSNGQKSPNRLRNSELASYSEQASENSFKIEQRMQELHSKRQLNKTDANSSAMKQAMQQKKQNLLKSKTC